MTLAENGPAETEIAQPRLLGVSRSARGFGWTPRMNPALEAVALAVAQARNVPEILGRVLVARGARPENAGDWFDPSLRRLMPDPASLRDMDTAATRFSDAIKHGESIAVFGDYDVDGAASAAMVQRFLRAHGLDCVCRIPDRLTEGYGPNPEALRELVDGGTRLILCVDCGTTSHDALAATNGAGVDIIVLDHHQAADQQPPAVAVVNPNRLDDLSGQGHLAAAGIVFLFLAATTRELRQRGHYGAQHAEPDLLALLDLVALATVCDVVPLKGVNRAFVAKGLKAMRLRTNPGLAALADAARLKGPADTRSLGFILGPRINAGGRIGDCGLGARLLATDDPTEGQIIAATLERLNSERRAIETAIFEDALAQVEPPPDSPCIIAVQGEGWHPGVLGLIASRLAERMRLPALALSLGPREAVGSLRSIPGVDVGSAVRHAVDAGIASKGGGHAMAGGVTLPRDKVRALIEFLDERVTPSLRIAASGHELEIDALLSPRGATLDFIDLLESVGPFGQGCPPPRLAFGRCLVENAQIVGDGHVRCRLRSGDGAGIDAIAFRAATAPHGRALLDAQGAPMHAAGRLMRDDWAGRSSVKFHCEDVAAPSASCAAS